MTDALTHLNENESAALQHNEAVIERGLQNFYEVGTALLAIRDARLYRESYTTWQEYLDIRWGFTRQRAEQFINAMSVVENVATIVAIQHESHARELAKFAPELQRAVAQIVIANAPDGKLTAPRIKQAAKVLADAVRTGGMVDTGSGQSTPINAALTVEEYEVMQRQKAILREAARKKEAEAYGLGSLPEDWAKEIKAVEITLYPGDWPRTFRVLRKALGEAVFNEFHKKWMAL